MVVSSFWSWTFWGHVSCLLTTNLQAVNVRCHLDTRYTTICLQFIPRTSIVTFDLLKNHILQFSMSEKVSIPLYYRSCLLADKLEDRWHGESVKPFIHWVQCTFLESTNRLNLQAWQPITTKTIAIFPTSSEDGLLIGHFQACPVMCQLARLFVETK